jgi:DNA invertase Pin-like site-specific DNA recombinase
MGVTEIGYGRVSTTDQDLSIQVAAIQVAGCDLIRTEKRSGTSTQGREELRTVLDFLRPGDVLMVTRIDRLARSIGDLQDTVRTLKAKGASLKATEQPIDTSTAAGKCFLDMLGVFAEFETNLRKERQMEGLARAKLEGVYKGRPASIARIREMKASGMGATAIADALQIGRASVYRALSQTHEPTAHSPTFPWALPGASAIEHSETGGLLTRVDRPCAWLPRTSLNAPADEAAASTRSTVPPSS